jgi:hypothetical protein
LEAIIQENQKEMKETLKKMTIQNEEKFYEQKQALKELEVGNLAN